MTIDPAIIRAIFEKTLDCFLENEVEELVEGVNERNNCGRMAIYLQKVACAHGIQRYFADMEYNRKQNGKIKTIIDDNDEIVTINCDLILHSRGKNIPQDNLIAIEVKKQDRRKKEKIKDRHRLRALTKVSYDDVWSNDGITQPAYVCGYGLGVFMVIDRKKRTCNIEYYSNGERFEEAVRHF